MARFIVGSGRCGSTLLSRMLAEQGDALLLNEFFNGLDMQRRFAGELSGAALAELLSAEQPFVGAVLRRGYTLDEVTYPWDGRRALPTVLVAALPGISDEPDRLYDETLAWLAEQPPRPAAEQYRRLFAWWGERLGRRTWIERSGSAIDYAGELIEHFPEARFVHLWREGPQVALSMREHAAYRLAVAFKYGGDVDPADLVGKPRPDDSVTKALEARPDPEPFARFWRDQLERGLAALRRLPADRLLTIRFEQLVAEPHSTLGSIADFLALDRGEWIARAASRVRPLPRREAPPSLEAICAPVTP